MAKNNHPIALARRRALLTQGELAEKAGVSEVTVWGAESGRPVSISTKRKLLKALRLKQSDHEKYFGPVGKK